MIALEIKNLTKYYGKSRGVIDINLEIRQGEVFGFIGPNGAGKSTTIRTLLALIYPTKGSAKIFGMDCIKDTEKIKGKIGYLPSEVNYYDDMRVKELFHYSSKFYKKDCSARIQELSSTLELDLNKKIDDLSFGNKKKVAIVQALLHEPQLLILDEPTGGLDPLMQNRFFEILQEENKKGVTIFFSSHILSEVQRLCDRVAIIKEGRILKTEHIEKLSENKYRRVKVEFNREESAKAFNLNGMVDKKVDKNHIEFLFDGKMNDAISYIGDFSIDNLWIEEPSLEDVFMHYYEKEAQ